MTLSKIPQLPPTSPTPVTPLTRIILSNHIAAPSSPEDRSNHTVYTLTLIDLLFMLDMFARPLLKQSRKPRKFSVVSTSLALVLFEMSQTSWTCGWRV
jgi:hypothetical protein